MSHASSYFPDFCRSAIDSSAVFMSKFMDGVERLQNYQVEAFNEIRATQAEMSNYMGSVHSAEELQSAQLELARKQMAKLGGYWSGLYATLCENQAGILKDFQTRVQDITDDISRKLEAVPAGSEPVVSAMKLVVGAAQSTCAATLRASEEMVRISAAQANAANTQAIASARQAKAKRAA